MENSRFLGNLPQNIVYNGLVYTYNLRENAFINQFGHRIDPSAAPAFITEAKAFEQQNLAILDISSSSSDNGNSRGGGETELGPVTNFRAVQNPDNPTTSIILEWDEPVSYTPDSYVIFRSSTVDGSYTQIGTVPDPEIKIFTDTGLTPDQPYFYYVKAVKGVKQSLSTDVIEIATLGVEPAPVGITAPSGLTASSVTQTQLRLSWADNSNNELGFFVYQSTDGLAFTPVLGVGAGVTSTNIRPLTQDTLYYYRVNAYATGSTSAYSNLISVRTLPNIPTAPSNLSLLVGGTSQIRVSWTDNSTNEQFFNLYRSTDGVSYPFGITLPAGSTTYLNTGLSAGTTYFYRVNAANTGGTSGFAGPVSATTVPTIPVAPSNLRFTNRTTTRLDLAWNDNSNNESGFLIQSSLTGVTYTNLDTVGANVTGYEVRGLNVGTTYFFQVAAFNAGGTSSFSGATSWQTLPTAPATPTFTSILAGSSSQININWTNVANEIGYNLYRSLNDVSYTGITTLSANVTGFTNSGLSAGTLYFYKIEAFNSGGTSALSGATSATTLAGPTGGTGPTAPTGFTAISATSNSVTLQWTDTSTNEDGFLIYYRGIT
jgi:predicted phage tail protein